MFRQANAKVLSGLKAAPFSADLPGEDFLAILKQSADVIDLLFAAKIVSAFARTVRIGKLRSGVAPAMILDDRELSLIEQLLQIGGDFDFRFKGEG